MDLTSEQVHWIGGVAFAFTALLLLLGHLDIIKSRGILYALPVLLVGYGIESFVDTWVHGAAAPSNYGAETVQHFVQGSAVLIAGIVEGLLLRGKLRHRLWNLVLPLALVTIAAVFLFHAQHDAGVSPLVMTIQHRVFALTLFVAALTRSLVVLPDEKARSFSAAWLLPLLLFGLQLLIYTETDPDAAQSGHTMEMAS